MGLNFNLACKSTGLRSFSLNPHHLRISCPTINDFGKVQSNSKLPPRKALDEIGDSIDKTIDYTVACVSSFLCCIDFANISNSAINVFFVSEAPL